MTYCSRPRPRNHSEYVHVGILGFEERQPSPGDHIPLPFVLPVAALVVPQFENRKNETVRISGKLRETPSHRAQDCTQGPFGKSFSVACTGLGLSHPDIRMRQRASPLAAVLPRA